MIVEILIIPTNKTGDKYKREQNVIVISCQSLFSKIMIIIIIILTFSLFLYVGCRKIVKANGLDMCRWYGRYPGKCGPGKCHNVIRSPRKFQRCECDDIIYLKKDHHNCNCYIKPPCRPN